MKVAIQGCAHGELETIYASLQNIETLHDIKIDLLLCCGDFQAIRNEGDLQTMACPQKFRKLNSFHKYYSGELKAPILTIFIGGNHEAASHLYELPYGGWVAPNIYYLGHSGSVTFAGLRIAGISGIYKDYHYYSPRTEKPPFTEQSIRSAYHQRNTDVFRLSKLGAGNVDFLLSHDWPRGITNYGDVSNLLRFKSFFAEDIKKGALGSPAVEHLLHKLQPKYHFSAHLHCKFPAIVNHPSGTTTKFLALDKVLPNRHFLQILDIPTENEDRKLSYDTLWLAILQQTHCLDVPEIAQNPPANLEETSPSQEDIKSIENSYFTIHQNHSLHIPENFAHNQAGTFPQTDELMRLLNLPNIFHNPITVPIASLLQTPPQVAVPPVKFPSHPPPAPANTLPETVPNPEEIDLDDI